MYIIFTLIIVFAGIPFGANRPWAWDLYGLLIGLWGLFLVIQNIMNPKAAPFRVKPLRYLIILMLFPVLWSLLQISSLTPSAWHHPFWALSNKALGAENSTYISLLPHDTGTALMRLMSYSLVFFISYHYNRDSDRVETTFKSIAYASVAYALYGLLIEWGHFNTVLWFEKGSYRDLVTSTFINRNSYATYAGLGLLSIFPVLFAELQTGFKFGFITGYGRQYFIENLLKQGWRPLFGMMIIATALLLTESRGGFISTLLAIVVFFLLLQISHKMRSNKIFITLLFIIGIAASWVFNTSSDALIERLDSISLENNDRLIVYQLLNRANHENPWLGNGYGSFAKTFSLYRNEAIGAYYDKAHNTYLENIFELGYIPAIALYLVIVGMACICLSGLWVRRRNWIYPALGVAATVLVGIHSLVDFSLQIPAVAYLYALIMGGAVAQSRSSVEAT